MSKEFIYSLIILFVVLTALQLKLPLETLLNNFSQNPIRNELLSATIMRFLISAALLLFMYKKGFLSFNGVLPAFTITNYSLLIIPIFLTLLIAFSNINTFKQAETSMLFLFGINAALTAILEEFTIRGTILPLMLKNFSRRRHAFFKAIFLSSLLFGIAHFIGLVRDPDNFTGLLSQVIFAVGIGFFLAALLFKTKNILAPIFIHFLINFSGGVYKLEENGTNESPNSDTFSLTYYVSLFVVSSILLLIGLYMLRNIKKEEWIEKTSLIRITKPS